ncbi:hypothetical protein OIDMADRAFT_26083 [Oidiodendron maius Zn]|uniref:Uncharacterized protein n=1 Tax=Oidiodendron maius (strain Zn) TaxID=913774 RepID=A0A0C3CWK1_OIDMZ|nr:hypothetical protein OIDMADRAFT_26083 [Oidiodendron maius Zn]
MWILPGTRTLWLSATFFFALTEALFLRSTQSCALGEYWCQDRCGSDAYGDTCCQTPDGQHNLCGAAGTICNAIGGCDNPGFSSAPQLPSGSTSISGMCGAASTITAQIIITEYCTSTDFTTLTLCKPCSSSTGFASLSPSCGTSGGCSTATTSQSSNTRTETTSKLGNTAGATTWTASDGQTIVSSGSEFVIGGSETVFIPSVTDTTVLVTDGETFTLVPPSTGSPSLQSTGLASFTSSGQIVTTSSAPENSSTVPGELITTLPNGQIETSSSGVVIIGSSTFTLPSVTSPTTLTTDGETFTLSPTSGTTTPGELITTLPDGQTLTSSSGVIIVGSNTFTLPSVTSPTTFTTDGETFTLSPTSSTLSTTTPSELITTLPDGQTLTSSSGVIIVGSNTFTLPSITSPTTFTTDGETFTLSPTSGTTAPGELITTLPDGQTLTSSSGVIIVGSNTITLPSVTSPTTLTTDGETFTLSPQPTSTSSSSVPNQPASTTSSSSSIGPLVTFTTWPSNAVIIPVTTSVNSPQQTDGGSVTPCHLWFFFICIMTDDIQIGGWEWELPIGIYPPNTATVATVHRRPRLNSYLSLRTREQPMYYQVGITMYNDIVHWTLDDTRIPELCYYPWLRGDKFGNDGINYRSLLDKYRH